MIQQQTHSEFTTFNTGISALIPFNNVCHIQQGKEEDAISIGLSEGSRTTWIHFNNGKCMHVIDTYDDVKKDIETFWDNY
tara:strand:+ start:278 stop:517 length:240 start_codon:yes stop_codon:yes gene_type:complete